MADHLYLVPGFFGFSNLGGMRYFGPAMQLLASQAPNAVVHQVPTHPTASLSVRAARLFESIATTSGPDDRVHLIGHSSGGLDARLLATPGVTLPGVHDPQIATVRIRSVVTLATPHHGTPSAEYFTTVSGKRVLQLLSLATLLILRRGQLPLGLFVALADLVRKGTDRVLQSEPAMVDQVFDELLAEFHDDRREQVRAFFAEIGNDQGLLLQITPDALQLFNAATGDRPGVRYGSVVTRARRPDLATAWRQGLNPTAQAAHAAFALMHALASRMDAIPALAPEHAVALEQRWPGRIAVSDNDGMVPSMSQPWGKLIRCIDADHLDVLGHYGDPTADPPRYDWFNTGTGFERDHFEATWTDIAQFCLG